MGQPLKTFAENVYTKVVIIEKHHIINKIFNDKTFKLMQSKHEMISNEKNITNE